MRIRKSVSKAGSWLLCGWINGNRLQAFAMLMGEQRHPCQGGDWARRLCWLGSLDGARGWVDNVGMASHAKVDQ